MADDDLWHVRIAPDDVKILSLERLDDLFRLDVIDADVLVWQPGMDEWLPLRVVAGIGDDAPEIVNINVSSPPPRPIPTTTATSWPPQAIPKQTLNVWPPPPSLQAPPPSSRSMLEPPSSRVPTARGPLPPPSAPPPSRVPSAPSRAPVSAAHSASSWPPPAAWDPAPSRAPAPALSPFATTVSAAQFPLYPEAPAVAAVPVPARPRAMIDTEIRYPRRRGGGTWVVLVALAAGAAVTLYRNAVVHAAAQSMGQEAAYLNLESALGGPSFGTPRAVERMTESSRSLLEAAAAAAAVAAPAATTTSSPTPVANSEEPAAPASKPAEPTPAQAATAKAASAGPTRPVSASAPAPRSVAREPDPVFKTPKKGKKGNEFDPLNGNL